MTHLRRLSPIAIVMAAVMALAGCFSTPAPQGSDIDSGYVSGDGTVRTFAEKDRSRQVTIEGEDFDGETIDTSDFLGQILVINTWYAECPPCRAEAADLVQIANERADAGVQFIGINGVNEAGAAKAYERTFNVPYPSISDRRGRAVAALQSVVPLQAVPTTVVLDQQGRVAASIIGIVEPEILNPILDDLLAEGSDAPGAG